MMATNTIDAYLVSKILSADPIELVRIMYRAAVGAVENARRHLARREISQRSAAITKALEILVELNCSLDHPRSPEISARLAQLYDYMQTRLLEANLQQTDAPLAEVLRLLSTLAEAWEQMQVSQPPSKQPAEPAPVRGNWSKVSPESEPEPAGHAWSF
jgi:flagellar protein FliS